VENAQCYAGITPTTPLLTYLLHGAVLLEKLTGTAAGQEIPRILLNLKVHYQIGRAHV
jgi:hypothetical protein